MNTEQLITLQKDIPMKLNTLLAKAGKPHHNLRTTVVNVNAAFADAALKEFNNANRPMSRAVAKLYANEMLRGKWDTNGEPIIFSIDDEGNEYLISGQHRLMALLICNQEVQKDESRWLCPQTEWDAVIVTGVPHGSANSIDIGKTRSHADVLFRDPWIDTVIPSHWTETINSRKTWTKTLAGAARLVWLMEGGATVSDAPKFLTSEMLEFIQRKHPELHKAVTVVLDCADGDSDVGGLKMSLPYIAALAYADCVYETEEGVELDKDHLDDVEGFIGRVAVGTGFDKGSAEWALTGYWNALTKEKGSKDRDREWVGPFIKALTYYHDGRTNLKVSDVKLSKKEFDNYTDFPILFPGWHTACFERAAAAKAAASQPSPEQEADTATPETTEDTAVTPVKKPRPPKRRKVDVVPVTEA